MGVSVHIYHETICRSQVFQRITENANAAMLHFQSPIYPELAVQSFMTYLHSFRSVQKCKCTEPVLPSEF